MAYFLGIIGTAKTSYAAVADDNGEIIKVIKAPPLSFRVNPNIKHCLLITIEELCNQLNLNFGAFKKELKCSCFAISGIIFDSDVNIFESFLEQIGFWDNSPIIICEDVHAHLAANLINVGGVIIAGTGSNIFFHINETAKPIRIDGWGSDLGDYGSGYFLGKLCLQSIFQGLDGRIDRSEKLEWRILKHLNLLNVEDLYQWFYSSRDTINWRSDISDLSIPLISAAEKDKDPLSITIVNLGIEALQKSLDAAISKSRPVNSKRANSFPIILEGGVFENSMMYRKSFQKKIIQYNKEGNNCSVVFPKYLPIVGSLALAISKNTFINSSNELFEPLERSAKSLGLAFNSKEGK